MKVILAIFLIFTVTSIFLILRGGGCWDKAKKKEDDWMSKREDYRSGKL